MAEHPFGHEPSAIADTLILKLGGIYLFVVLALVTALYFVLNDAVMPLHQEHVARQGQMPPSPRLQPHPDRDLAALRAEKHGKLSGYAWTDHAHTVARIPIERAMKIYVRQQHDGPPARGHASDTDRRP